MSDLVRSDTAANGFAGFEIMVDNPPEPTLVALENNAPKVVGKDWVARLDKAVASNLKTRRTYKGNSVRDLLRAMRNKVSPSLCK